MIEAGFERLDDRRTPGRLRGVNARQLALDQTELRSSRNPLRMRGSSVPPATGDTTWRG